MSTFEVTRIARGDVYGVASESVGACAREYFLSWVDAQNVEVGDTVAAQPALLTYETAEFVRPATAEELAASVDAATRDGGCGVIMVDGVRCYVIG